MPTSRAIVSLSRWTLARRARFRLSTLIAAIGLLSFVCAWTANEYRFVQKRRAYWPNFNGGNFPLRAVSFSRERDETSVPWYRRLLGGVPVGSLVYDPSADKDGRHLRRTRELFPEAKIWGWPDDIELPEGIVPFDARRGLMI